MAQLVKRTYFRKDWIRKQILVVMEKHSFEVKMVAVDLDGTLLRDDKTISSSDLAALGALGIRNIIRVAATGRSLHKVYEVLEKNTPFDYIVFSSGSGIFDWNTGETLTHEAFTPELVGSLFQLLLTHNLNFVAFQPIPENNRFHYYAGGKPCDEFKAYLERHHNDGQPLDVNQLPVKAGQFMCIMPYDEVEFDRLRSLILEQCWPVKIIRTTSPVNSRYIWMEIFPESVSKGHGLLWLCRKYGFSASMILALGNDFNDLDMLEFSGHPWLVANSCEALKARFATLESTNNESSLDLLCRKYNLLTDL